MPLAVRTLDQHEFLILRNLKPIGKEIGRFNDVALYSAVEDEWGRIYTYAGVCPRVGQRYVTHLATREFIQPPGIVYRMIK